MAIEPTGMLHDAAAPRAIGGRGGLFGEPANNTPGNEADRAELESRRDFITQQLREAITRLPMGSSDRGELEATLSRVLSLRPDQLTAQFLNSVSTDISAAFTDAAVTASAMTGAKIANARERRAHFKAASQIDYYDNPFVRDGRVEDIDGFAKRYGFEEKVLNHHASVTASDPGIHRNPDLMAFAGTFAKVDPEYRAATLKARTVPDQAANDMTGLIRNMPYMDLKDRQAFLEKLDQYQKSTTLTLGQRDTMKSFRHMVEHGFLDADAIADIRAGNTFNDFDRMKGHVDRARSRYQGMLGQATNLSSPESVEALRELAQARNIDVDRPAGEWLSDLRIKHKGDPEVEKAYAPVKENMQRIRSMNAYVDVIKVLEDKYTPAERDRLFYNASAEQRMTTVRDIYNATKGKDTGHPMTPDMENVLRYQINLVRTPEDARTLVQAVASGKADQFYQERHFASLEQRVKAGDQAAIKDMKNLQAIDEHIKRIESTNPSLATTLRQEVRSVAFDQLAKNGSIDYNGLAQVAASAVERSTQAATPNGARSEAALEKKMEAAAAGQEMVAAMKNADGVATPSKGAEAAAASVPLQASPIEADRVRTMEVRPPAKVEYDASRIETAKILFEHFKKELPAGAMLTPEDVTIVQGANFLRSDANERGYAQVVSGRINLHGVDHRVIEATQSLEPELKQLVADEQKAREQKAAPEPERNEAISVAETAEKRLQRLAATAPLAGVSDSTQAKTTKEADAGQGVDEQAKAAVEDTKKSIGKAEEAKQADAKVAVATPKQSASKDAVSTVKR